jgi:hypothetical protein
MIIDFLADHALRAYLALLAFVSLLVWCLS